MPTLRSTLQDPTAIAADPFHLLRQLASLVYHGPDSDAREAVLRALEFRSLFYPHEDILDSLVMALGLYPYADPGSLSLVESLTYEFHRPLEIMEDLVFHREQGEIYRDLLRGENIVVSAPTSFGKSKVIDAMISTGNYPNVLIVVPTLALIDETRRRLAHFRDRYKLVSQLSQPPAAKNLFIMTGERVVAYDQLPKIDLFVLDEFYKIGAIKEDERRTVALNQAFARVLRMTPQLYMLGPSVKALAPGAEGRFSFKFVRTDFSTVVADEHRVLGKGKDLARLLGLAAGLSGPTIVYCKSPGRANVVAQALIDGRLRRPTVDGQRAAEWIGEHFHPQWTLAKALANGIGIHHGRLPRSLAQYVVRAFNDGILEWLVCTSTLIEGVNTRAKNVIIFDKKIASSDFDFFTFNNIRGRSGRMFKHFVGNVYLFHEPPQEELPLVDFPLLTQGFDVPESLLLQLDEADLSPRSQERLEDLHSQSLLPVSLLRSQPAVEPADLLALARQLTMLPRAQRKAICWSGIPSYEELLLTCEFIWNIFVRRFKGGVASASQLAFRANQLRTNPSVRARVLGELSQTGRWAPRSPSEAVEKVLEFDRSWASFDLPKYLLAFDVVRRFLFDAGDYSHFASRVENLFQGPFQVALEEYGLPIQVSAGFRDLLEDAPDFDAALSRFRDADPRQYLTDSFEISLFEDAARYL